MSMLYNHFGRKIPDEKPILAESGYPGYKHHAGWIDEEFHVDLRGDKARKMYREMGDNDPVIGSGLWLMESLLRRMPWSMNMNESGHPLAEECSTKVDESINDMATHWSGVMSTFSSAFTFGYSYIEPTYKIRKGRNKSKYLNSKHDDGHYGWRDWEIRAQETRYRWEINDDGSVAGMWQQPPHDTSLRFIPIDRALHFRLRPRKGNPEGYSLLRVPYTSYYYARRHREIGSIGVERNIAGYPIMEVPPGIMHPNASAADKLIRAMYEDMVKKVRVDSQFGLVLGSEDAPDGKKTGYRFRLASSGGRNFGDSLNFIKHYETRMAVCLFTQFLLLGQDKHGSYALSSDMTHQLAMALGAVSDSIAEIVNDTAIPRLCDLNGYPPECYPEYLPGDIEKQSIVDAGTFVSAMISSGGMEATPDVNNWARGMIDLPPAEDRPMVDLMRGTQDVPEIDTTSQPPVEPIEAADELEEELPAGMDADEVATMFGISRARVNAAIKRGQIPGNKIGNKFVMLRENVMRWIEGGQRQLPGISTDVNRTA